jgi:hypothetical protein
MEWAVSDQLFVLRKQMYKIVMLCVCVCVCVVIVWSRFNALDVRLYRVTIKEIDTFNVM